MAERKPQILDLWEFQRGSTTWRHIEAWAKDQLESARTELERRDMSEIETATLRGRIQQIRRLLDYETDAELAAKAQAEDT